MDLCMWWGSREEGQTHATNHNGSPFCTHYVAIYYCCGSCCSGSLASSLARSPHLSLSAMPTSIVGVAALLTFGREDTVAVPCRNKCRKCRKGATADEGRER